jgi:hypothetical protein
VHRLLIAAGLLAALAGAAPARGTVVAHHVSVDRLRLAGGRVLLARRAAPRSEAIDLVARGRAPRRLALLLAGPSGRCTGDSGGDGVDFGFDASAQAVAASSTCAAQGEQTVTRVFAGLLGQPAAQLTQCSPPGLLRPAVAVTGTQVAYIDDACTPGGRLVVHDLAGAPERRFALPPGETQYYGAPEALQAAGPFLAYDLTGDQQQPAAGVLDLRTGDQRTVGLAGDAAMTDLAVDAAGRVLVRREGRGDCGVVELHDPAEAPARVLEPCADDAGIGLADGRAAYFARGRLHAGGAVLAALPPRVAAAHLAFDGARAAYDVPECGGDRDVVVARAAGRPAPGLHVACPFSIPSQRPRLTGTRITVRAVCPRGCADAIMMLLSADRRRHLADFTDFAVGRAVERLSVAPKAARAIRRRGRLDAVLRVAVRRLDGRYRARYRRVTIVSTVARAR